MTRFSANLGFLWTDRPLPDAIRAAAAGDPELSSLWAGHAAALATRDDPDEVLAELVAGLR